VRLRNPLVAKNNILKLMRRVFHAGECMGETPMLRD
jgi:hypothetical protein